MIRDAFVLPGSDDVGVSGGKPADKIGAPTIKKRTSEASEPPGAERGSKGSPRATV